MIRPPVALIESEEASRAVVAVPTTLEMLYWRAPQYYVPVVSP